MIVILKCLCINFQLDHCILLPLFFTINFEIYGTSLTMHGICKTQEINKIAKNSCDVYSLCYYFSKCWEYCLVTQETLLWLECSQTDYQIIIFSLTYHNIVCLYDAETVLLHGSYCLPFVEIEDSKPESLMGIIHWTFPMDYDFLLWFCVKLTLRGVFKMIKR